MANQQSPIRDMGPCQLDFNAGAIVIGGAAADYHPMCSFQSSDDKAPVHEATAGSQPVSNIFTGKSCVVKADVTRATLAVLTALIPGASGNSGDTATRTTVKVPIGDDDYERARPLILKPIVGGVATSDQTQWLTVAKAAPSADLDIKYDVSTQRTFPITFQGYRVREDGNGWKTGDLYRIGG